MIKTIVAVAFFLFLFLQFLAAQVNNKEQKAQVVNPGTCGNHTGGNAQRDGNEELGMTYSYTKCGLDYVQATLKLGQRGTINGVPQPAAFVISGIPPNAVIEQAYVWSSYSGTYMYHEVSVTNPNAVTMLFEMVTIGNCKDKCWSYDSTKTYRADVTPVITGNGTYMLDDLPTNPPNPLKDTDGATLFIIFSDSTSGNTGSILIKDGCKVQLGGISTDSISGFVSCDTSLSAKAFTIVGDLQLPNTTITMNGIPINPVWNWMNFVEVSTTVNFQQTTSTFEVNSPSDCYNVVAIGLQWFIPGCASYLSITTTNTNDSCGTCSATATAIATGGYPPYVYQWDANTGNQTTATATGLCAGSYDVTVTDSTGCPVFVETVTIFGYGSTTSSVPAACANSCDGDATVLPFGGIPPYSYQWDVNTGNQTTQNATGLCTGIYYVTVTDNLGCTIVDSVTVSFTGYASTVSSNPSVCANSCDGDASVFPVGGNPPFTYLWDANAGNQTTSTATGLCPGIYYVSITDSAGCAEIDSILITGPPAMNISITVNNGNCSASATVTANGGNGAPYYYSWSTGATTNLLTGLSTGTYFVTVRDSAGCGWVDSVTVSTIGLSSVTFSTDSSCGGLTGSATVTPIGGIAPFMYQWNDPDNQTTATATGLAAGTYIVTVTDYANCLVVDSVQVGLFSSSLPASASLTPESCKGAFDGEILLTVSGFPPFTFLWSNDATTDSLSGLQSGIYLVTITDSSGCALIDTFEVELLSEVCTDLNIPSAFTPNGDLINDTWIIRGIDKYPQAIVEVYNRWGSLLFTSSKGYPIPWDGKFTGIGELPAAVYYYIITLGGGEDSFTGTITLIK